MIHTYAVYFLQACLIICTYRIQYNLHFIDAHYIMYTYCFIKYTYGVLRVYIYIYIYIHTYQQ